MADDATEVACSDTCVHEWKIRELNADVVQLRRMCGLLWAICVLLLGGLLLVATR